LIIAPEDPSKAAKVTEAFLTLTRRKGCMTRKIQTYSYTNESKSPWTVKAAGAMKKSEKAAAWVGIEPPAKDVQSSKS